MAIGARLRKSEFVIPTIRAMAGLPTMTSAVKARTTKVFGMGSFGRSRPKLDTKVPLTPITFRSKIITSASKYNVGSRSVPELFQKLARLEY